MEKFIDSESLSGLADFYRLCRLENLESKITKKEAQNSEEDNDQYSLDICIIAENLLLLSVYIPNSPIYLYQVIIGLVILAAGLLIRISAVISLGAQYNLRIRRIKSKVVATGIYRFIRHPAYLGTIIAHTGLIMIGFNIFSIIALILWYAAVINRTNIEDRYLLLFAEYSVYSSGVKWRLFPLVW